MPITSAKNQPLSGAATDLGMGDALNQQVQNETEEQKRKRMQAANQQMQSAVNPAVLSLFGSQGGYGTSR